MTEQPHERPRVPPPIDTLELAKLACDLSEALYSELKRRELLPMLPSYDAGTEAMKAAGGGAVVFSLEDEK